MICKTQNVNKIQSVFIILDQKFFKSLEVAGRYCNQMKMELSAKFYFVDDDSRFLLTAHSVSISVLSTLHVISY